MEKKIIQVDEKVPVKMLIPLSLQHMFAMFGASVLVPFLFGISPAIVLLMHLRHLCRIPQFQQWRIVSQRFLISRLQQMR